MCVSKYLFNLQELTFFILKLYNLKYIKNLINNLINIKDVLICIKISTTKDFLCTNYSFNLKTLILGELLNLFGRIFNFCQNFFVKNFKTLYEYLLNNDNHLLFKQFLFVDLLLIELLSYKKLFIFNKTFLLVLFNYIKSFYYFKKHLILIDQIGLYNCLLGDIFLLIITCFSKRLMFKCLKIESGGILSLSLNNLLKFSYLFYYKLLKARGVFINRRSIKLNGFLLKL